MADKQSLKQKFEFYLRSRGLLQYQLARDLHISGGHLNRLINGHAPWPLSLLTRACEILGINDEREKDELLILAELKEPTATVTPDILPREEQPKRDAAILETTYLQKVAAHFARLPMQFGPLSAPLHLRDVYLDLPIFEPSSSEALLYLPRPGQQWSGKPLPSLDTIFQQNQAAALVGVLGRGKTTTLRHLAWAYAERPEDRFDWRQDELIPFYAPIQRLAQYWTPTEQAEGADGFIHALASAVASELSADVTASDVNEVLQTALAANNALVLLDALDELQAPEPQRGEFVHTLQNVWMSNFVENQLLLTSRPYRFLNPYDFKMYAFQLLQQEDVEVLVSKLGTVLLKTRQYIAPTDIRPWLQQLKQVIFKARFQEFWSPFYVTLMVHLGTSKVSSEESIALLEEIRGVTSLYDIFIRETIQWERNKRNVPETSDRDLKRVLAYFAYYTLAEPQIGGEVEESVIKATRLDSTTFHSIQKFWLTTGLLFEDKERHSVRFRHSGFLAYGVAYAMADLWRAGQRDKVDELCRRFESDMEYSLIVTLFIGLSGQ